MKEIIVKWLRWLANKIEGPYRQWVVPPMHPGCRCDLGVQDDDEYEALRGLGITYEENDL